MRKPKLFLGTLFTALLLTTLLGGCSREAKMARHLERADSYFKSGDYEKARIEYLNVLKLEQVNPRAIRQLGCMFQEQGAPVPAYRFLLKAQELYPEDREIAVKFGFVNLAIGEVAKAQESAIALLGKDPLHDEALLLLAESAVTPDMMATAGQWLERVRGQAGNKAAFHLASAQLAFRKKDVNGAETAIRQALLADPKSAVAHMAMGDLFRSRSNLVQAEQEFKLAAELAPVRSPVPLKYAEFKANANALPEAKQILNEVTQKTPDYLPAWSLLAQIAFTEKDYDECIKLSERVLNVDQASLRTRQLLAQARLAKGQTAQAIQDLETLNTLFPKAPQARYQLALAYLQTTNFDRASAAAPDA